MLGYALLAFTAYVLLSVFQRLRLWRGNYLAAKASGFPVYVVPVYALSRWWTALQMPIVVVLYKLPKSWIEPWLELSSSMHQWWHKYSSFAKMGSDTYITVSPTEVMCWTCDPECVTQVLTRRGDFGKPTDAYKAVNVYGNNVVSSEGQYWRHHRRIVAPPFDEKNNRLVWEESLLQAYNMIRGWTGMDGNQSRTITTMQTDTMRLSLYIISKAGFGKSLPWPGVEDSRGGLYASAQHVSEGHKMTYLDALNHLLNNLVFVIVFPAWMLRYSPFARMRLAHSAFVEWGMYMGELYDQKKTQLESGKGPSGHDLMDSMIHAASGTGEEKKAPLLSREEIMGNSFVFMLAGHETTANSLHFSFAMLAQNFKAQRRLQADLDAIFGDRPVSEWSYEKDLPRLFGGFVGASMREQLRLIPPIVDLPRKSNGTQAITIQGQRHVLPSNTSMLLGTSAASRNPKYWPHGPPTDANDLHHPESNCDNDLEEFKPERWTENAAGPGTPVHVNNNNTADPALQTAEADDLGGPGAPDTPSTLFKPVKGSYFPFSEGIRSCLGRRFAQVEYAAVLAVIFKEWSVELAVDEWATDAEVEAMTPEERKEVWMKANQKVRQFLNYDMVMRITLQLRPEACLPLRFVRRGKERFNWAENSS